MVAATIHLHPSGRQFSANPNESLLEAGLRSGIAIPYRCSNGSCGECKGRIVSGAWRELRHHDYPLSQTERDSGAALLCCIEAESDLQIELNEVSVAVEIPRQSIKARVAKLEHLQSELLILHLRTPRSQALQFLPGQFATLTLPGLLPRYRSIASCPCRGGRPEFHIRDIPGDPFSTYCFNELKVNDEVLLEGPEGALQFDPESTRPLLFFAYDTGFAPIKSLAESAINRELSQPIHLYWLALDPAHHYFENLCRSWADAFDNFSYGALHSSGQSPDGRPWDELTAIERVVVDYPDLSAHDVYIAGPQAVVSTARNTFARHGHPPERFFAESLKYF